MAYPINYVRKFGILTFDDLKFNKVDGLIFSVMALIDVERSIPKDNQEAITFKNVIANHILHHGMGNLGAILSSRLTKLLYESSISKRYSNLKVHSLFNKNDLEEETQSTFFMIDLNESTSVIVFGSTDDSINGWKEDINMLVNDHVPCLKYACEYVNDHFDPRRNYYFIGHSKGGFESLYAACFCNDEIKDHIIKAVSYDGPGYSKIICDSPNVSKMKDKLRLYSPDYAIVSRLFNQMVDPYIIKCSFVGPNSHDPSCWNIDGKSFILTNKYARSGENFAKEFNKLILSLSNEERHEFIDNLFTVFNKKYYLTLTDVANDPLPALKTFIRLPKKNKKVLNLVTNKFLSKKTLIIQLIVGLTMARQNNFN